MANYLVTVATTVYNQIEIEADSRDDAWTKAHAAKVDYNEGEVYETPYIESLELLD